MKLVLQRRAQDPNSTPGDLYVDGTWYCCTLELPKRDGGPGSCIDAGTYPVTLYNSPHFMRKILLLQDVPLRSYIEIHPGNWPKDTHGCIVTGTARSTDAVWLSDKAYEPLFLAAEAAIEAPAQGCTIEVRDAPTGVQEALNEQT